METPGNLGLCPHFVTDGENSEIDSIEPLPWQQHRLLQGGGSTQPLAIEAETLRGKPRCAASGGGTSSGWRS